MKGAGLVTLLSVLAIAAAPSLADRKAGPVVTAKSTEAFAHCFAQAQDRRSAAWWFVPSGKGGTFSNAGAAKVQKPYFVIISDRGTRREIELQDVAEGSPEAGGIKQCI
jgi:hypothetical protein